MPGAGETAIVCCTELLYQLRLLSVIHEERELTRRVIVHV